MITKKQELELQKKFSRKDLSEWLMLWLTFQNNFSIKKVILDKNNDYVFEYEPYKFQLITQEELENFPIISWDTKLEIIWHPLLITDILKALNDFNYTPFTYYFKLDWEWDIAKYESNRELIKNIKCDLSKPLFIEQSNDFKEEIYNLLMK